VRNSDLISEVLALFSLISATAASVAKSAIMLRFAMAFLGFFSSLVVYLHGEIAAGLVLLFSSCILLPYLLSELPNETEKTKRSLCFRLFVVVAYLTAVLAMVALFRLGLLDAELAILACIGLAALTIRESLLSVTLGLVFVSQAVLIAVSIRNPPLWLIVCSELCRFSCISVCCRSQVRRKGTCRP